MLGSAANALRKVGKLGLTDNGKGELAAGGAALPAVCWSRGLYGYPGGGSAGGPAVGGSLRTPPLGPS